MKEIQDYLSNCDHQKKLSPNTIRAYKIDANYFLSFLFQYKLQNEPASTIGKEIIQQFVDNLLVHYAPRTCKRKNACIFQIENIYTIIIFEQEEKTMDKTMKSITTVDTLLGNGKSIWIVLKKEKNNRRIRDDYINILRKYSDIDN